MMPYYRLQEEGTVLIAAEKTGKIRGILGTEITSNMTTGILNNPDDNYLETFDLLVLPGGVKAMEKLRQDKDALKFVKAWADRNKPIASICSGAQMLISARVHLIGRHIAAYPAMAVDVENTGAVFVNEPVVVDGNIISSPHYNHLAAWMKVVILSFYQRNPLEHVLKYGGGGGGGGGGNGGCGTKNMLSGTLSEYATQMRFYGVSTLQELVSAQVRHIERLQAKLTPLPDTQPRNLRQG